MRLRRFLPDVSGLPRPFWVLVVGTLVNRTGGFVLIFLAIYLTEVHGLTAAQAGAVISAYGLGAIVGGPLGGALADRVGRVPTLVASLVGGGLSMLLLGLVTTTTAIVAAALLTGLLYEMYRPVVAATVSDVVKAVDRPRAYALIYVAVNLGASIAPILGGVIAARSYRALFAADAATTMLYGVIVWAALPETRPARTTAETGERGALRVILGDTRFLLLCLLSFTFCVVFFQSFTSLPLDMRAKGISASTFGALIAINGALIVVVQPYASAMIRDHALPRVLAVAALLLGAGFGMNAWIDTVPAYALAVVIWTLGEILFAPASMTFVAELAPDTLRGRYQGVFSMAFTSAFAAAPAIGGLVLERAGSTWLWGACFATGLAVAAGYVALGREPAVLS